MDRYSPSQTPHPGFAVTLATVLVLGALMMPAAPAWAARNGVHPLDPLTASELGITLDVMRRNGYWDEATRFPMMTLQEPDKAEVLGWKPGDPVPRRAFLIVKKGGGVFEAVIDVVRRRVESWKEIEGVQPGILLTDEWRAAQQIVRRHPGWREGVRQRGIDDYETVVLVPMTVGHSDAPAASSVRLVKVVSFDSRDVENYWGRPIEGLIAVVNLDAGKVVELIDTGVVPIPGGAVDLDEGLAGETRDPFDTGKTDRSPSPGFELAGHWISWQEWNFHWRVDPRVGLVISLVSYEVGGKRRSILYQASLSEMFVPYTDPDPGWHFRAFMDAGEYGIGRLSSELEFDLDCPATSRFLHAIFADDWGNSYFQRRVACVFERTTGDVLWRHHDGVTGRTLGRKLTELVLRQVATVGNYDYVLDWIFRPDASIRVAVGTSGVPAVKAVESRGSSNEKDSVDAVYGRRVAEHTVAINHDHFFSYRLDLDVDGRNNSLLVERLTPVRLANNESRRTTWILKATTPATESQAKLRIDLERPALWRVINPDVHGPLGYPVSYQLVPERNAVSLFGADDVLQKRAGFTDFHLWVTPYRAGERYAAGTYPNQSGGGDGLPDWTREDRSIRKTDIVLWYTLGMHHVVRAEDWPVLPTTWSGFELRPFDFFERNPALRVPE